jgi:ribosomal 50S subunit-recycling heat shock protein
MRLDLFLKKTSLIKRRTIAKEIVEKGFVMVNEKIAKPSTEIKSGDIISLTLGVRHIEVVAKVEMNRNNEVADYELIQK